MGTDVGKVLEERGTRYGEFEGQAEITQQLKSIIRRHLKAPLANDQQESLDMICSKIARITNGDPNYLDNWVDIEGYAKLIRNRLEKEYPIAVEGRTQQHMGGASITDCFVGRTQLCADAGYHL